MLGGFGFAPKCLGSPDNDVVNCSGSDGEDVDFDARMNALEFSETDKTLGLLLESDYNIYLSHFDLPSEVKKRNAARAKAEAENERPRYFSVGYEANVDPADELELARWQKHFPYLHVAGEGYSDPTLASDGETGPFCDGTGTVDDETSYFEDRSGTLKRSTVCDLCVVGKRICIEARQVRSAENCTDEEIFAQDGTLDELFFVDASGEDSEETDCAAEALVAEQKMRARDELWAAVLPALRPLVQAVANLPYREQRVAESLQALQATHDAADVEDDGWW